MNAIANQQNIENHPLLDQQRELLKRKSLIKIQIQSLFNQLDAIKVEFLEIEQKRKDINRVFYQLRHEFIQLNPKGLKGESRNNTPPVSENQEA